LRKINGEELRIEVPDGTPNLTLFQTDIDVIKLLAAAVEDGRIKAKEPSVKASPQ
jgi:hypothetical protein